MPDIQATTHSGSPGSGGGGKVEEAKQEAGQVADAAKEGVGQVASTAKEEAKNVAGEVKSQARELFAQTQTELRDQAAVQQRRVADGMRSVGDELQSMARNSEGQGVAADLVGQAAGKLTSAASWLGDRDPGSLLTEVKSFARRKPGMFIAGAAIAGLVVGRLTRALASNAHDESESGASATGASGTSAPGSTGAMSTGMPGSARAAEIPPVPPVPPAADVRPTSAGEYDVVEAVGYEQVTPLETDVAVDTLDDTPVYGQTRSEQDPVEGFQNDRRDTL